MNKKICDVHGTDLKRQMVPISYGLPPYDPAWDVQKELFPHSHSRVLGGCSIDLDSPSESLEYVCDECRRAEQIWREENDDSDLS